MENAVAWLSTEIVPGNAADQILVTHSPQDAYYTPRFFMKEAWHTSMQHKPTLH